VRVVKLPSPALIVAAAALFIALGGVAGAATTMITTKMLQDNSVTRAKIAVNSINSSKIEDGSIQSKDLSGNIRGERGPAGAKGANGDTGARGPAGAQGEAGTSGVSEVKFVTGSGSWSNDGNGNFTSQRISLSIPAGSWAIIVSETIPFNGPNYGVGMSCSLMDGATVRDSASTTADSLGSLSYSLSYAGAFATSTTLTVDCSGYNIGGIGQSTAHAIGIKTTTIS